MSWCQRALELNPLKYTGCCVLEATTDFCNGWLIAWSWSIKLFHSEISLKHFVNEHYLCGVMSVVSSPWVLDPLKAVKEYHRGTSYLQKGIWLLAQHQWSGIPWLEAISHVATNAVNASWSLQQRSAGLGTAHLCYAAWCSQPAEPCRTPSLASSLRGCRYGTLCPPQGGAGCTPPIGSFWCLDGMTPLRSWLY